MTCVLGSTVLGCKLCTVQAEAACWLAGVLAAQSIPLRQVGEFTYHILPSVIFPFAFLLLCLRPQLKVPSKNFVVKSSREDKVYRGGGVCAYVSLHECGCLSARAMCCVAFLTLIPFHFILFSLLIAFLFLDSLSG